MSKPAELKDASTTVPRRLHLKRIITTFILFAIIGTAVAVSSSVTDVSRQTHTKQLVTKADGDILNFDGTYVCNPFGWFGLPLCNPPRPADPGVSVDCADPKLTVAIMIDRSDSVIRDTGGATPGIFKDSVELLLDDLYSRFEPNNGELTFIIYAFGTKSVVQYTGDASTQANLDNVKSAIEKIHFRNGEYYTNKNVHTPGFQSLTTNPYDLARAYDAGSENAPGVYGLTNWHDALVKVLEQQSGPYNNPDPGKKIDLAVMFTDGFPDKDDGHDWRWTPGEYEGNDPIGYSWDEFKSPDSVAQEYLSRYRNNDDLYRPGESTAVGNETKNTVDVLRSGALEVRPAGTTFAARPKVSVRGIIIRPNATAAIRQEANNWGNNVFSGGNFYFAENFDNGLKTEISKMSQQVMEQTNCGNLINPIRPGLTITADTGVVTPMEGDANGQAITYTVHNSANGGDLDDVVVCLGGSSNVTYVNDVPTCSGGTIRTIGHMNADETVTFTYNVVVPLGGTINGLDVIAVGRSLATDEELIDPATGIPWPRFPTAPEQVEVIPERVNLPS